MNGSYETRGTHVHPELIPHIASWVSPDFAVMVSKIVNTYIIREYQEAVYERDVELGKLQDKIDELINTTKEVKEQNKELINATKEVKEQNNGLCYLLLLPRS